LTQLSPASPPILQAEQRAWSQWLADGLPHLTLGGCLLLTGLAYLHGPNIRKFSLPLAFLLVIANLLGFFFSPRIISWLKSRIADPRTGYVGLLVRLAPARRTKPADGQQIASFGGGFAPVVLEEEHGEVEASKQSDANRHRYLRDPHLVMIFLSVFILYWIAKYSPSQLFCVLAGVSFAAGVSVAAQLYLRRSWSILCGLLFGAVYYDLFDLGRPGLSSVAAFILGTSFSLISVGAVSLTRYLQANPDVESPRR
jgi:hypothetical protein